jgi:uncharacterized protein YdiU (UPF0061 family)
MSRADLHRVQKEEKKQKKTFTLTKEQLNEVKRQAADDAIEVMAERAFILMLALPLEVLITENYWKKSAKKKLPKFMDEVLRLYTGYQNGQITLKEMEDDLWEFGGLKCERPDQKEV